MSRKSGIHKLVTQWRFYPMASDDRRIQLREGIHQLVAAAAAARCVSPASLVSMVMYDYLRTCGELATVTQVTPTATSAPKPKPAPWNPDDHKWEGEAEDNTVVVQRAHRVPTPKPVAVGTQFLDDDDEELNYGD